MKDWFCLPAIPGLFAIISTFSLREEGCLQHGNMSLYEEVVGESSKTYLSSFVLRNFMLSVLLAVLSLAIGPTGLGNINLRNCTCQPKASLGRKVLLSL